MSRFSLMVIAVSSLRRDYRSELCDARCGVIVSKRMQLMDGLFDYAPFTQLKRAAAAPWQATKRASPAWAGLVGNECSCAMSAVRNQRLGRASLTGVASRSRLKMCHHRAAFALQ